MEDEEEEEKEEERCDVHTNCPKGNTYDVLPIITTTIDLYIQIIPFKINQVVAITNRKMGIPGFNFIIYWKYFKNAYLNEVRENQIQESGRWLPLSFRLHPHPFVCVSYIHTASTIII